LNTCVQWLTYPSWKPPVFQQVTNCDKTLYSSTREFGVLVEDSSSEAVTLLWNISYNLFRAVGAPTMACIVAKMVSWKANWKRAGSM